MPDIAAFTQIETNAARTAGTMRSKSMHGIPRSSPALPPDTMHAFHSEDSIAMHLHDFLPSSNAHNRLHHLDLAAQPFDVKMAETGDFQRSYDIGNRTGLKAANQAEDHITGKAAELQKKYLYTPEKAEQLKKDLGLTGKMARWAKWVSVIRSDGTKTPNGRPWRDLFILPDKPQPFHAAAGDIEGRLCEAAGKFIIRPLTDAPTEAIDGAIWNGMSMGYQTRLEPVRQATAGLLEQYPDNRLFSTIFTVDKHTKGYNA
jgi:hypothetical protein